MMVISAREKMKLEGICWGQSTYSFRLGHPWRHQCKVAFEQSPKGGEGVEPAGMGIACNVGRQSMPSPALVSVVLGATQKLT